MSKLALIDGDIIAYKVGFATQETRIELHINQGMVEDFPNRTEAYQYIQDEELEDTNYELVERVYPKPLKSALYSVKAMANNIMKRAGCDKYLIYIDGEGNFRNDIATIRPYKGNRKSAKPVHFKAIKSYIINKLGGVEIKEVEADDALSIAQYIGFKKEKPWVICTIDKDAKNTPGWLFNFDKDIKPNYINEMLAYRNFFKQMLLGDTVDNIVGCRGVGDKSKLMIGIDNANTTTDMFKLVTQGYVNAAQKKGHQTKFEQEEELLSVEEEFLENGRLLWMLRKKDDPDLWHPVIHCGVDHHAYIDFKNLSNQMIDQVQRSI